jgi:hypothetical protein
MRMKHRKVLHLMLGCLVGAMAFSCNEINRQSSPVVLIVTFSQDIHKIDVASGCTVPVGTVNLQALLKNPLTASTFNDVKISSYRVSYVRTDGGTVVPAPFVKSISTLITVGGGQSALTSFNLFDRDTFNQAPLAALQPQNGGRDPETGKAFVQLDEIIEFFGQTTAGESVSGSTRIPFDFCYNCGGCT